MNAIQTKIQYINKCKVYDFPGQKTKKPSINYGHNFKGAVNAIKDENDVQRIKEYFLNHTNITNRKSYGIRNYALMVFGFNTALRASDILSFTIGDFFYKKNNILELKDNVVVEEKKNKNIRNVYITKEMKEALILYLETNRKDYWNKLDEPLFASRQRDKINGKIKPIDYHTFWELIKLVQRELNIKGRLGTHSCRKTVGRRIVDKNRKDPLILATVQKLLGHKSPETTLTYLDITRDEINYILDDLWN